jgi:molecular chaperone GrpE
MGVPSAAHDPELAAQDAREPAAEPLKQEILTALTALQEVFDAKIRYDEVRERQIAALHDELEAHRRGLYLQILKPVLLDIIGLYDDIAKTDSAMAGERAFLLNSVEEILRRYGAETFACEGNAVDRSRQRVIDTESTDSADLDRLVAHRVRPGFGLDGRVLRPEWVVAYRYSSDREKPAEGDET